MCGRVHVCVCSCVHVCVCVDMERVICSSCPCTCSYRCYPKYSYYVYGDQRVSFGMSVNSSNEVSCHWSHNGTQIMTEPDFSPYRISGRHNGVS